MESGIIKEEIKKLLDKYNRVLQEKEVSKYNEEMTKKDFILPLFRALGWNTEDSNEVTAEEKISKKRVDYGFRINGIPKFFLEAKALKEDLDNIRFVEQAINYAWHKGCTWAVLTNFESIKIYNAEWKIGTWQSHFMTIPSELFLERFDDLWLLSKESFEKGLLDKQAEKYGKRTKKIPVDKQLLNDFTRFRELLSKNITKLNQDKNITEEELDEAVQRILDRLIFIRNCEDRELEAKTLISSLREWESKGKSQLIKSLREVFSYFDSQYNSKIFTKHLCDDLDIDNEVLHEIIEGLYFTKDKSVYYDFSAIEADVLGNIYEQYLGHILKKSEKRAKITKNHAHRKEQGIYYTPTYIVDYIVRNTLGEMLKDKKVDVEKIRILDPACGSGSFLIKAFDVLNEYYLTHDKNYSQTQIDFKTGLPFTTKVKILKNNIFGVDLDKQAVEIAQLNLLLKIAEKGHRLPLLQENIKCGNSLIDDPAIAGDKAFKWEEEFKEIMKEGGFDVVIGNPPYFILKKKDPLQSVRYFNGLSKGVINSAAIFVKRGFNLLKTGGYLGFIIPKSFLYVESWSPLRKFLLEKTHLLQIIDVSKAFKDVKLEQVIIIFKKEKPTFENKVILKSIFYFKKPLENIIQQDKLLESNLFIFDKTAFNIFDKVNKNSTLLGKISENFRGISIQKYCSLQKERGKKVEVLGGKQIDRYNIKAIYGYTEQKVLNKYEKKIESFEGPRILAQNIIAHIRDHIKLACTYDESGAVVLDTVNNIKITDRNFHPKYVLALLNSKLISFYTYFFIYFRAIRTMHFDSEYSGRIPIKKISIEEQQPLITLVDKMLSLNKHLNEIGNKETDERAKIEEEIKKTDAEIDELVYKIYGITEEEKKIIEEALK
jgi:type I restriction-modification system DNA methylase subunit